MSGELLRSELITIHNLLIPKLTPTDMYWLKENRGQEWDGKHITDNMTITPDSDSYRFPKTSISLTIQDMVDAILHNKPRQGEDGKVYDRKETHYRCELSSGRIIEIAMILGCLEGPRKNKFQILGRIKALCD